MVEEPRELLAHRNLESRDEALASTRPLRPGSHDDLDLALDLDRNVEGKLGESNGASGVSAGFRPVEFENEILEPVHDARLLLKTRSRVDHAKDATPGSDAVEVS